MKLRDLMVEKLTQHELTFKKYKEDIVKSIKSNYSKPMNSPYMFGGYDRLINEIESGKLDSEYIKPAFERNDSVKKIVLELYKLWFGNK